MNNFLVYNAMEDDVRLYKADHEAWAIAIIDAYRGLSMRYEKSQEALV